MPPWISGTLLRPTGTRIIKEAPARQKSVQHGRLSPSGPDLVVTSASDAPAGLPAFAEELCEYGCPSSR
jgi:hypothetical protein